MTAFDVVHNALDPRYRTAVEQTRAVLAALKDAGYAVVALPTPRESLDPEIAAEWLGGEVMTFRDGRIELDWRTLPEGVAAARSIAAALLAAADAAEENP